MENETGYNHRMGKYFVALLITVLWTAVSRAAFEPVAESPLLQSGVASSLFPASPLAITLNPVSIALLEGHGVAASASRPFGLRRLDRSSVAGCLTFRNWASGCMISVTGDESYAEITVDGVFAWKPLPRVAAGIGCSVRRLQITGYGRATGAAASLSAVWAPVEGLYSTALVRNLVRTDIGSSGDPAGPRSIEMAMGVVPVEDVVLAIGVSGQEGVDIEYEVHTGFTPVSGLRLCTGIRTGPARFWAAVEISLHSLGLQYGYGEHAALPGTHSIALSWGDSGFRPEPLDLGDVQTDTDEVIEFPLNVNIATAGQLEQIPGIGPAKASAIVSYIRTNGPVSSIDSLEEVPGIGQSLIRVLADYLVAE